MKIAIVGATGLVGSTFLKVLEEKNISFDELYLFASKKSAGKKIDFRGKEYIIEELNHNSFDRGIDIALFSAGGSISKEFAPLAAAKGCLVIDNSSAWRMDSNVPLIVPEVNGNRALDHKNIIANPNCSTIQCVAPLNILNKKYGLKRVVYSTYQAVSGAGIEGIADLENSLKGEPNKKFPYPIVNNCIPHIDVFLDNGYTKEEEKMINETRKILDMPNLPVTATCVRVPVINSHSISISAELNSEFDLRELVNEIKNGNGIILMDDPTKNIYPIATKASGQDLVLVGRIRRDFSVKNGINFWTVADNIRKGAASNTIEIAELFLNKK